MNAAFDLADGTAILERTPRLLDAWLRGLPAPWLETDEGPDTFSPYAVVGHLICGERTDWIQRVRRILEHGEGLAFEPFDRFAHQRAPRRPIEALLDEFTQLRGANLVALRALSLTTDDLARRGRHPDFGTVTLGQLLSTWVAHDLSHLGQIARVMAKRYGDAVGPWRQYLRILSDRT